VAPRGNAAGNGHHHERTGRNGPAHRATAGRGTRRRLFRDDEICVHRIGNVLQVLPAEIDEFLVELVAHLAVDALGDADRPRPRQRLQTCGDVDRVAEGAAVAQ